MFLPLDLSNTPMHYRNRIKPEIGPEIGSKRKLTTLLSDSNKKYNLWVTSSENHNKNRNKILMWRSSAYQKSFNLLSIFYFFYYLQLLILEKGNVLNYVLFFNV